MSIKICLVINIWDRAILFSQGIRRLMYIESTLQDVGKAYREYEFMKKLNEVTRHYYFTFIRPHSEFASETWRGGTVADSEKLGQTSIIALLEF